MSCFTPVSSITRHFETGLEDQPENHETARPDRSQDSLYEKFYTAIRSSQPASPTLFTDYCPSSDTEDISTPAEPEISQPTALQEVLISSLVETFPTRSELPDGLYYLVRPHIADRLIAHRRNPSLAYDDSLESYLSDQLLDQLKHVPLNHYDLFLRSRLAACGSDHQVINVDRWEQDDARVASPPSPTVSETAEAYDYDSSEEDEDLKKSTPCNIVSWSSWQETEASSHQPPMQPHPDEESYIVPASWSPDFLISPSEAEASSHQSPAQTHPSRPIIALENAPIHRVRAFLRNEPVSLPVSVQLFLEQNKKKAMVSLPPDNPGFLQRFRRKRKALNLNLAAASLMATLRNTRIPHAGGGHSKVNSLPLANFCALALVLGCRPQWLLHGDLPQSDPDQSPEIFQLAPLLEKELIDGVPAIWFLDGQLQLSEKRRHYPPAFCTFAKHFRPDHFFKADTDYDLKALITTILKSIKADGAQNKKKSSSKGFTNLFDPLHKNPTLRARDLAGYSLTFDLDPWNLLLPHHATSAGPEEPATEVLTTDLLWRFRSAALIKDETLPPSIQLYLEEHDSDYRAETESDFSFKAFDGRVQSILTGCNMHRQEVSRLISGDPLQPAPLFQPNKPNVRADLLCCFAWLAGVRPQWLLRGDGERSDPDQKPQFHLRYQHPQEYYQLARSTLKAARAGNTTIELPSCISNYMKWSTADSIFVLHPPAVRAAVVSRLNQAILTLNTTQSFVGYLVEGTVDFLPTIKTNRMSLDSEQIAGLAYALGLTPGYLTTGKGRKSAPGQDALITQLQRELKAKQSQSATPTMSLVGTDSVLPDFPEIKAFLDHQNPQERLPVTSDTLIRLRRAINACGLSDIQVSKQTFGSPNKIKPYFRNGAKQRKYITRKEAAALSMTLCVNPEWLAFGQGEVSRPELNKRFARPISSRAASYAVCSSSNLKPRAVSEKNLKRKAPPDLKWIKQHRSRQNPSLSADNELTALLHKPKRQKR